MTNGDYVAGVAAEAGPPALPDTDDPRVLLGLGPDAGAAEIKQAYRSLVLQHHPDKGGTSADFQRIHAAAAALGAGGGDRPCVAPLRQSSHCFAAATCAHQLPLPCASDPTEWRMVEATNGLGYRYLCVARPREGPCLALHRDSLGGFQWRRRRPYGCGWFDAEAFADGQGSMVTGMVNMVGAACCTAVAEDDRAHTALQRDRQYEWGNWLLAPRNDDNGKVDVVLRNRKLPRSSYCIHLAAGGVAVFVDTRGGSHDLC